MKNLDQPDWSVDLFATCARVHASFTGSGDTLPMQELAGILQQLSQRLHTWTPSHKESASYDNAVRELVMAAFHEAAADLMLRPNVQVDVTTRKKAP